MPYLVEQSNLLFVVYGHVEEKDASLSTMRVVSLSPPELSIKVVTILRGTHVQGWVFILSSQLGLKG